MTVPRDTMAVVALGIVAMVVLAALDHTVVSTVVGSIGIVLAGLMQGARKEPTS